MSVPRTTLPAVAFAALLTLGLGACSGNSGDGDSAAQDASVEEAGSADDARADGALADSPETSSLTDVERAAGASGASGSAPGLVLSPDQLDPRDIIRTGTVAIEADDPEQVRDRIGDLLDDIGGYVSDESAHTRPEGGVDELRVVIQVPTDRFDEAVEEVSALGEVTSRAVQAEDVTRAVADIDSRVESARAALDRVRALLDRAVSLGTVIRLEGVLSHRQSDLESLLAQQQALAGQTALGTLEVEVTAPDRKEAPADDQQQATGFLAGLDSGWDALGAAFVVSSTAVGAVLPFAAIALVVAVPVLVWRRRSERQVRPAPPATP